MTTPTDHATAAANALSDIGKLHRHPESQDKIKETATFIQTHAVEPAVKELVEALTLFAKLLQKHHDHLADFVPVRGINGHEFTVGDLRHARALVAKYTHPTPSA